jgi:soluble cytochrome b562
MAANEAYLPGSPKRMTDEDDAMLLSYIETQPRLDLLEAIIENADSARIQETKETAKKIIADPDSPSPADLGFAKDVPLKDPIKELEDFSSFVEQENKVLSALELEIQQNALKMEEFMKQGDMESAKKIADEIKRIQKATEKGGDSFIDKTFTPPDRSLNAEGGRIGFEPGGDVPGKGKLPMSRRGFMGIMGGGIAAALTAGKGLMPAAKTGITAAKTMSAPGMPKWFPLLVGKIQTKGNLVSPAAPNKGEVNAVYKYKDGMTEYRMVEDVNTGRIDIYTTADDGTQVSFEYEPSMKRYFEDGRSVTEDPSFFVGEFRKGSEPGGDFEEYSMGMDEVVSDLRNVEDFAIRGTTQKVDDAIEDFIKRTRTEEPGFKQGGLVPPQAGPMSSGMGSLFRQRTV